jgi:hypothetical protein
MPPFPGTRPSGLFCRLFAAGLALLAMAARAQEGGFEAPSFSDYLVLYFPPPPPPYGAKISDPPRRTSRLNGKDLSAPEDMAEFVGETFYSPLGSRLLQEKVGKKMEARLDAYRMHRGALLDELSGELFRLRTASKAEREQALQTLAPRQAARLAELEAEAEQLRHDLVDGGLFTRRLDWNAARGWRLHHPALQPPQHRREGEFQLLRAAAYFDDGFSIEQRGLLREMAIDAARLARRTRGQRESSEEDPALMFFSPDETRLRLPQPLPPELLAKIGRFNTDKAALKRELLELLTEAEKLSDSRRAERFSTLAFGQAPRIAALEKDAEDIRRDFDTLRDAPAPWVPPIFPELRVRIESYNQDRNVLFAEYNAAQLLAAQDAARIHPGSVVERSQLIQRRAEAMREAARKFESDQAERIDALRVRHEEIKSDLTEIARGLTDPRTGKPLTMDTMLEAYRVAMQRFDEIGREEAMYERYKIAMLQPGLSPAQRRLLFRAAHAQLSQALPLGEYCSPMFRQPRPRS